MPKRKHGPRSEEVIEKRKKKLNKRRNNERKSNRSEEYKSRKNERRRKRIAIRRSDSEFKFNELEKNRNRNRSQREKEDSIVDQFLRATREGPTIVCTSCSGRFFRLSTKFVPTSVYESLFTSVEPIFSTESSLFCITCARSIKNKDIPRLCTRDGLELPEIHYVLRYLSQLEERLVSPVLPFMQVRALGIADKQYGLRGQVVNVPIDVPETVNQLPGLSITLTLFRLNSNG